MANLPNKGFAPPAPLEIEDEDESNVAPDDPNEEVALPDADADGTDEGDEDTSEDDVTYDSWLAQLESNDALREEHESRTKTREKEHRAEEYRKFQRSIQPAVERWSQNSTQTKQAVGALATTLQKAVRDGTLEPDDVAQMLQDNQPVLDALNQQMWWEGSYYLLNTIGTGIENESLANEFLGRLYAMAGGKTDPDFGADLLSAITDSALSAKVKGVEEAAYNRGVKDGQRVNKEQNRAAARKGAGPDTAPKRASGSSRQRYTIEQLKGMSREQLAAIPREQRDAMMTGSK